MFNLSVKAYTPVGQFAGLLNGGPLEDYEAVTLRDELQKRIVDMTFMVLNPNTDNEIMIAENTIKNSVFTFSIQEI